MACGCVSTQFQGVQRSHVCGPLLYILCSSGIQVHDVHVRTCDSVLGQLVILPTAYSLHCSELMCMYTLMHIRVYVHRCFTPSPPPPSLPPSLLPSLLPSLPPSPSLSLPLPPSFPPSLPPSLPLPPSPSLSLPHSLPPCRPYSLSSSTAISQPCHLMTSDRPWLTAIRSSIASSWDSWTMLQSAS